MVIWKGWFETAPCRATLATPFPALCPRILGTRFTDYGLRMFWGELMVIWKGWFETVPCRFDSEHPIFSPLSKKSRNTVYKLRFASLRGNPPPSWDFQLKTDPPLSWRLGLALPPPRATKKIKNIRNVHQELVQTYIDRRHTWKAYAYRLHKSKRQQTDTYRWTCMYEQNHTDNKIWRNIRRQISWDGQTETETDRQTDRHKWTDREIDTNGQR